MIRLEAGKNDIFDSPIEKLKFGHTWEGADQEEEVLVCIFRPVSAARACEVRILDFLSLYAADQW